MNTEKTLPAENPQERKAENQFTKGTRPRIRDRAEKDAIRAEFAAKKLEQHAKGEIELSDSQVAACKALMPYGKATLQSVQQTITEQPVDEQETMAQLAHLLAAKPEILAPLVQADPGVKAALRSILSGQPVQVTPDAVSSETSKAA